ncbi:hypothetical protein F53441_11660 [Fusarium austroafricanum]|uniref:Uncharacterized protein n=1 Tax=Fusarium austroafricanum TaxID=2364996 RepID=A0A8H4K556_9HYPO|nr:hypothetical protein F53441_11660 [Fusarium austroafricanum]
MAVMKKTSNYDNETLKRKRENEDRFSKFFGPVTKISKIQVDLLSDDDDKDISSKENQIQSTIKSLQVSLEAKDKANKNQVALIKEKDRLVGERESVIVTLQKDKRASKENANTFFASL